MHLGRQLAFSLAFLSVFFALVAFEEVAGMTSEGPKADAPAFSVPGMVYIPEGEFISGTMEDEKAELARKYDVDASWFQGEPPQTRQRTGAFYIDKYEVTNAQFKAFLQATGSRYRPAIWFDRWPDGFGSLPVCGVSYDVAQEYAAWIGKRLPTALEWEKAARGTDGRRYPWGNEWSDDACDHATWGQVPFVPKPVGYNSKDVSPYGVYGCAGGAAEWTTDGANWTGGQEPDLSFMMGGTFLSTQPYNFRCASRAFTQMRNNGVAFAGFRCVLDASAAEAWVTSHPNALLAELRTEPVASPEDQPIERPDRVRMSSSGKGAFVIMEVPAFGGATFSFQVPEVIFSSRGLIFLGHKMQKGWRVSQDRTSASLEYREDRHFDVRASLTSEVDCVDVEISVVNKGNEVISRVISSSCLSAGMVPWFRDPEQQRTVIMTGQGWTALSKVDRGSGVRNLFRHYRVAGSEYDRLLPTLGLYEANTKAVNDLIAVTAIDRPWVAAAAAEAGGAVMSNGEYTCIHSEPYFGDIKPGETVTRHGKLYFLRGTLDDLEKRASADGFGKRP